MNVGFRMGTEVEVALTSVAEEENVCLMGASFSGTGFVYSFANEGLSLVFVTILGPELAISGV